MILRILLEMVNLVASGILGVFIVSDVNKLKRTGGATHIHTMFLIQTVLPLMDCAKSIKINGYHII
jgi:hypothetical protein